MNERDERPDDRYEWVSTVFIFSHISHVFTGGEACCRHCETNVKGSYAGWVGVGLLRHMEADHPDLLFELLVLGEVKRIRP